MLVQHEIEKINTSSYFNLFLIYVHFLFLSFLIYRRLIVSFKNLYKSLTKEAKNGTMTLYTYDANGNRATMTQNGVTTTYTYDANNRLMKETVVGAVTSYEYDANGNLINAWNAGNPVGAYSYNLFGNQTSFTADSIVYTNYTYRPDGLRQSIGDKVHVWDGANIVTTIFRIYLKSLRL